MPITTLTVTEAADTWQHKVFTTLTSDSTVTKVTELHSIIILHD